MPGSRSLEYKNLCRVIVLYPDSSPYNVPEREQIGLILGKPVCNQVSATTGRKLHQKVKKWFLSSSVGRGIYSVHCDRDKPVHGDLFCRLHVGGQVCLITGSFHDK